MLRSRPLRCAVFPPRPHTDLTRLCVRTYYALSHVGDVSLRLAVDTGSADLWLISSACTSSACSGLPKYPLAFESSTFQGIDNNQTSFAVSYADGTGAFPALRTAICCGSPMNFLQARRVS